MFILFYLGSQNTNKKAKRKEEIELNSYNKRPPSSPRLNTISTHLSPMNTNNDKLNVASTATTPLGSYAEEPR